MKFKTRILLCFLGLNLVTLLAVAICILNFRRLEDQMEMVNNIYIPVMKNLNQAESALFLMESDWEKSIQEGIPRPRDSVDSVFRSRFSMILRLLTDAGPNYNETLRSLKNLNSSYAKLDDALSLAQKDWKNHGLYLENINQARAEFRSNLKEAIRGVDVHTYDTTQSIQKSGKSMEFIVALVLVFSCAVGLFVAIWLSHSVRPLTVLSKIMRKISSEGLNETVVGDLSRLPESEDEFGDLAREFSQMSKSVLGNRTVLEQQKKNIEATSREIQRQNLELKTAKNKLLHSEKLSLIGSMAAQMAHEIRNPLNALGLHVDLIENGAGKRQEVKDSIEPMKKEIRRLIALTDSYLDMSKQPKVQKSEFDLSESLEDLYEFYTPLFKEKNIHFTCDLASVPGVEADKAQLVQVLSNLIKNSIEAFDGYKSDAPKYVRMISQLDDRTKEVVFTIMDNGKGMTESEQSSLFSPFVSSKAQGTGLGLALSKQVIDAHGGEIDFKSEKFKGTRFTLKLPLNPRMQTKEV